MGTKVLAWCGLLLLLGYAAFLHHHTSLSAGGSDSSGYLNASRWILEGRLVRRVEALDLFGLPEGFDRVFIPLGFVPGAQPGTWAPSYPPGLPLHMALARLLTGSELAPFFVSPLAAVLCLLLTFWLGRELSLEPVWAAAGAAMLGAFPAFVFQAVQSMSDVVATLWCLAAVLTALLSRRRGVWALGSGAAFGIAVLVRPTSLLLILPLVLALRLERRSLLRFGAGVAPFALFGLLYNAGVFAHPLQTGYGSILSGLALGNFPARFTHYSYWVAALSSPVLVVGWLLLSADRRVPARNRALLLFWFAVFFLFYCFYPTYEIWWYTRFLLPGLPAMILGALLLARDLLAAQRSGGAPVFARRTRTVVAAALFLIVCGGEIRWVEKNQVHKIYKGQKVYPEACQMAERLLPPNSLVLSMQMSGALEYYTDLPYAMWVWIEADRLNELRERVRARGYGWYALLMDFELEEARSRFPGRWTPIHSVRDVTLWRIEPYGTADRIGFDRRDPSHDYDARPVAMAANSAANFASSKQVSPSP